MDTGRVLELRTGEPAWYGWAVTLACLAVIVSLIMSPLRYYWTACVLLLACLVLVRIWRRRETSSGMVSIYVHPDFTLSLERRDGSVEPVCYDGAAWVSPWLTVIRVRLPRGKRERIVVSRDLNSPDAFRRFTVICRFGFAGDDQGRQNSNQSI